MFLKDLKPFCSLCSKVRVSDLGRICHGVGRVVVTEALDACSRWIVASDGAELEVEGAGLNVDGVIGLV